jgi:hypothetical protein
VIKVEGSNNEDYKETSEVANNNEEEGLSEVNLSRSEDRGESNRVIDDNKEEVIRPVDYRDNNPSGERRGRKRKI